MPDQTMNTPITDSIPKVEGEVAVGEDLDFQRAWWRFERIVWAFFMLILVCDLLGLFGRGLLAKAKRSTPDNTLQLDYERIERAATPSIMTLHFGPEAIHGGRIQIFVSESITHALGAQRISPQPLVSAIGGGGVTYTFAATQTPATMQISLEPSFPGLHHFRIEVLHAAPIEASVFVVP